MNSGQAHSAPVTANIGPPPPVMVAGDSVIFTYDWQRQFMTEYMLTRGG
jgi:hypothetical protein